MNKIISKKIRIIFIVILFCFTMFLVFCPSISAQDRLFNLESIVEFSVNEDDMNQIIKPLSEQSRIGVNVTYSISGTGAELAEKRFKDMPAQMYVSVESTEEWLTAVCSENVFNPKITTDGDTVSFDLLVTANDNTPAYSNGIIIVNIEIKEKMTPIAYKIKGLESSYNVSITPGYLGALDISSNNTYYRVTPYVEETIPVKIENLGNGKTEVFFNVKIVPDSWNVNITKSLIIDSRFSDEESTETVPLKVTPSNIFNESGKQNIDLEISYRYYQSEDDEEHYDDVYTQTFTFEDDGSYKEADNGEGLDNIQIMGIFAFVLLIFFVIILVVKKFDLL